MGLISSDHSKGREQLEGLREMKVLHVTGRCERKDGYLSHELCGECSKGLCHGLQDDTTARTIYMRLLHAHA